MPKHILTVSNKRNNKAPIPISLRYDWNARNIF